MSIVNPVRMPLFAGVAVAAVIGSFTVPTLQDAVARLSGYPAVVVLALITVTGETLVLAAVVVATQGDWALAEVVLWCFLGTVVSDAVWFWAAGVIDRRWESRVKAGPDRRQLVAWLRRRTGERPYVALLFIKFLYGSRFLMLVYLATQRVPLSRFLAYDAGGTVLWLLVLVPAGWLVAHGLVRVAAVGRLDVVALAVAFVLLVMRGGSSWVTARARRRSLPS